MKVDDVYTARDGTKAKVTHVSGFLGIEHLDEKGKVLHPDDIHCLSKDHVDMLSRVYADWKKDSF